MRISSARAALVVAHPGHELTLTGWLEMVQPTVFVITDGSGQLGRSRLHSTTNVLHKTGARPGSLYGHFSDREVYEAMLRGEAGLFLRMALELADWIALTDVDYVVGDSAEGYNPMHDMCRIIVGAAVELASRRRRPVDNYEYVVTGPRDDCDAGRCSGTIRLRLNDDALARKIETALAYPELSAEVQAAVRKDGMEGFRHECLHPVDNRASWTPVGEGKPFYEEHGEARVASGKYQRPVRYAEHVVPLRTALWKAIDRRIGVPAASKAAGPSSLQPVGGDVRLA